MWISLCILIVLYVMLVLSAAFYFFLKGKKQITKAAKVSKEYNLLLALRNEETQIDLLFESISKLKGLKKILIVNDHSSDGTLAKIASFLREESKITLIDLPENLQGKKAAIRLGLNHFEEDETVLIWDADNSISNEYAVSIATSTFTADLRLMPVWPILNQNKWYHDLAQIEAAGTWAINALLAHYFFPITANGANLMLKKSEWVENVNWIMHASSGDDLAILKAAIQNEKKIELEIDAQFLIESKEADTWPDFIARRVRWAGKPTSAFSSLAILVGILILAANWSIYYLLVTIAMGNWLSINFIALKLLADVLVTYIVFHRWKKQFHFWRFFIIWWIYPSVLLWIGFKKLTTKQQWKERSI